MATVKPPRLKFEEDRATWTIHHQGKRTRLGLARGEADEAQRKLAEFVLALGTDKPKADRSARETECDPVLERYLARRTDEDPSVRVKEVARPRELGQRVAKLAEFWGGKRLSEINEDSCERFAAFCGSDTYARRCLGDFQAAINEFRRAGFLRELVLVSMPPPPDPREDFFTLEEAIALAKVCWRKRDEQMRKTADGHRRVVGRKRPWAHLVKFLAVAIATCSRSSRVFKASYRPEPGLPYVDLEAGILYRMAVGEKASKKRAPPVDLNERIVRAMRRWSSDRVVGGRAVPGDRYVVQWGGRPADPKGAFVEALVEARRQYPKLFLRRDGTPKHLVRHSLRHTGITWLAQDPSLTVEDIVSYAGITRAMFDRVYAHHHGARSKRVMEAQAKRRKRK